tara:strand:+ start:149 stop:301 length:153 start_codon:yes stop_codon:yes gene_type:complete
VREKHALAFLQWRMLFVKNKGKDVDLKEILDDRIEFMKASAQRRANFIHS